MKAMKITATIIAKCVELAIMLVAVVLLFGEPAENAPMTLGFVLLKFASFPMFWVVYKIDIAVGKWWGIEPSPEDDLA